ncbi:hypothetical protein CYMTET_41136 [Cymbomonas tetramitiformis]|uniref:Response regulatory domain-containing protein n=1 Tax=Cymbomonas tetramitiformis TaxID=36881 RepID=A0AAE0C6R0_9CHLO|nr:hypothetical protein CYMTET_41136 [Cymbomonas tetramitiformis]
MTSTHGRPDCPSRSSSSEIGGLTEDLRQLNTKDWQPIIKAENTRILVVDDDRCSLLLTTRMLKKLGYSSVTGQTSAREALRMLESSEFELVLLDISMPEISGLQMLQLIRNSVLYENLAVVMLTCMNNHHLTYESVRLGADDYLTKPVTEEKLKHLIHHVWRKLALKNRNAEVGAESDMYSAVELKAHCSQQIEMYKRLMSIIDDSPHLFPGEPGEDSPDYRTRLTSDDSLVDLEDLPEISACGPSEGSVSNKFV